MSQTTRQMIIHMLREGRATAKDISSCVGIPEKEAFPHLGHIRKSLHHGMHRYIDNLSLSARTFGHRMKQRFFLDEEALYRENSRISSKA